MVGTVLPPMLTFPPATRLSIFCRISRETSLSELISGTTSSWRATFLYSIFDATAAVPVFETLVLTTLVKVLTGIGTSWPEAMMAFLLLLVKTIGREITRSEEHTSELQSHSF